MTDPNSSLPDGEAAKTLLPLHHDDMTQQQEQVHVEEEPERGSDRQQSPETVTLELAEPQPELQNHVNDLDQDEPDGFISLSSRIKDAKTISIVKTFARRRGAKKRKLAPKQRAAVEKKLEILIGIFKPIPFVPVKALDFSRHEDLLKRLGLWEFAHIEFDLHIRGGLLVQLIANFDHVKKFSYVKGARFSVNRTALARALNLPVKAPGKKTMAVDRAEEGQVSNESIAFIEDFVSNWMLLHEDDTWMMPNEISNWFKVIKAGHFDRVDWAGLIWFMLEKELLQAPQLVNCFYASHLQRLIGTQRESILKEEEVEVEEIEVKEEPEAEHDPEQVEDEEEEEDGDGDLKVGGDDDFQGIELSLGGQENNVEEVEIEKDKSMKEFSMNFEEESKDEEPRFTMNFDENKQEEPRQWITEGKSSFTEPFLGTCFGEEEKTQGIVGGEEEEEQPEPEDGEEEEEEDEMEEGGFHISPKGNSIDGFASNNFIQAMEMEANPFSSGLDLRDNFPGEFPSARDNNTRLSLPFTNNHKRPTNHDDDDENGLNKRLRSDNDPQDFETCMEQAQHFMEKARMIYAEKEHSYQQSTMNQQYFLHELQQRDNLIEHLRKAKYEEQHKSQTEVYRLERELYVMQNLLEGYRKALKDTHKAFSEYRERCSQADEPLYKDVPGSGGLVLSVMELEKQRLKQEEEDRLNRLVIERKVKDFEDGFDGLFEGHFQAVSLLGDKLMELERKVEVLKESAAATRGASERVEDPSCNDEMVQ